MNNDEEYYIWGAGLLGERVLYHFAKWINIVGFIDRDVNKQKLNYMNMPVMSFEEYIKIKRKNPNAKVIIAILVGYQEIQNKLESNGVYDYYNFIDCPQEYFSSNLNHIYETHVQKKIITGKQYIIYGKSIYSVIVNKWVKNITGKYAVQSSDIQKCIAQKNCTVLLTVHTEKEINYKQVIDLYNCTNEIAEYYNRRLEIFKDCNKGKRCFIVGLGPSLKESDLNVLHDNGEISISMNSIDKIFDKTKWRPDYYEAYDFRVENQVDIDSLDVKYKIIGDTLKTFSQNAHDDSVFINHVLYDFSEKFEPSFSENFAQYCSAGATITYECIQFAVYMGIKEIYLLGVDFSGYGNQGATYGHFYEEKAPDGICFYKQNLLAYQSAKKYADAHGIKIYNATRGGNLEVFERVDFDSLFK